MHFTAEDSRSTRARNHENIPSLLTFKYLVPEFSPGFFRLIPANTSTRDFARLFIPRDSRLNFFWNFPFFQRFLNYLAFWHRVKISWVLFSNIKKLLFYLIWDVVSFEIAFGHFKFACFVLKQNFWRFPPFKDCSYSWTSSTLFSNCEASGSMQQERIQIIKLLDFVCSLFPKAIFFDFYFTLLITKTRLYNFDPLKPHFYVVKLGFTGE